jgi:serine-type D-Ala-D-Ala carboxypeptidase/endopeptidase
LQAKLDARFKGDRSNACVVAALIDNGQVLRAKTCAQPRSEGAPGFDS